jgi:hypothetical protein
MATLDQFSRRTIRLASRLDRSVERFVGQVAIAVDREVVLATPVDTGRARANWLPSLNAPNLSAEPNTFSPDGGVSIARTVAVANRYRLGSKIYITNSLWYIEHLNRGGSPQAPSGYVGTAIDRGIAQARALGLRGL